MDHKKHNASDPNVTDANTSQGRFTNCVKPAYYGYMNGWAHTPPEVEHCRDVLGHQLTRTRDNTRGTVEVCTCKLCGYWYRIDSSG